MSKAKIVLVGLCVIGAVSVSVLVPGSGMLMLEGAALVAAGLLTTKFLAKPAIALCKALANLLLQAVKFLGYIGSKVLNKCVSLMKPIGHLLNHLIVASGKALFNFIKRLFSPLFSFLGHQLKKVIDNPLKLLIIPLKIIKLIKLILFTVPKAFIINIIMPIFTTNKNEFTDSNLNKGCEDSNTVDNIISKTASDNDDPYTSKTKRLVFFEPELECESQNTWDNRNTTSRS